MSLLRKASFGRRPSSRAQAPEAEAEAEEAQADAEGPKKGIGRLLRSASFERRSRRSKADAGANGAPGATDESEGSSTLSERTPTTPEHGELRGWLLKRHSRGKSAEVLQWAHRYFSVDDVRGTLSYSKAEIFSAGKNPAMKKPSAILPLADISQVVSLEGKDIGPSNPSASELCFLISCPPVHLTVSAKDRKTRDFWINGLQSRSAKWREKLGPVAASVSPTHAPSETPPPPLPHGGHAPREPGEASHGAEPGEAAGPSVDERHESLIEGRLARECAEGAWRASAAAPPDERPEAPPAGSRPGSAAPRERRSSGEGGASTLTSTPPPQTSTPRARPQSASTSREGRHVAAARRRQEAARARANAVVPPPLPPGYGTEELHSEEEEEEGEARARGERASGAGRSGGVPGLGGLAELRDLADMLSSDEEDEDAPPRGPLGPVVATPRSSYAAARLPSPPAHRSESPPAHEAREAHEEEQGRRGMGHGGSGGSSACACASAPSHSRALGRGGAAGAGGAGSSGFNARAALADRLALPPLSSTEEARADPMAWLSAMPDSAYGAALDPEDPEAELERELDEAGAPGARPGRQRRGSHAELLDRHFEALATPFESPGDRHFEALATPFESPGDRHFEALATPFESPGDRHFEARATPFESLGEPPAEASASSRRSRRTAQLDAPGTQEERLYAPPVHPASPPPPPVADEFHGYDDVHDRGPVVVGDGYHADPDFVNEAWDSDDEQ